MREKHVAVQNAIKLEKQKKLDQTFVVVVVVVVEAREIRAREKG